jgi:hypothetical protein
VVEGGVLAVVEAVLEQHQAGPVEGAAQDPLGLQVQALVFHRAHLHLLLPEQAGDDGDRQRGQQQRGDDGDAAFARPTWRGRLMVPPAGKT